MEIYAEEARSIDRLSAIKITCTFRTVSHEAVGIIVGLIPPDIMAMELNGIFDKTKSTD